MKMRDMGLSYDEALHGVQSAIQYELGQTAQVKTTSSIYAQASMHVQRMRRA